MKKFRKFAVWIMAVSLCLPFGAGTSQAAVPAQETASESSREADVSNESSEDFSGDDSGEMLDESKIFTLNKWKCMQNTDGTLTIGGYSPAMGENPVALEIPDELPLLDEQGKEQKDEEGNVLMQQVTKVGFGKADTRNWPNTLESITIPLGITKIDEGAFFDCDQLKTVTIPDSVQEIGSEAFRSCYYLETIRIPEGVTVIEESTFEGCTVGLKKITLPSTVTNIEKWAFKDCNYLSEVVWSSGEVQDTSADTARDVPADGINAIGVAAFLYCRSLARITVPEGFTKIGGNAFCECDNLQEVTLPSTMTEIEGGAFCQCRKLAQINLPDSIETIGDSAFQQCEALTGIDLPPNLEVLQESIFYGCTALEEIIMPEALITIEETACEGCTSLCRVELPENLETIGADAFFKCTKLAEINIPNTVTQLGAGAFRGCTELDNISLSNGLTEIAVCVFEDCTSLKTITLPQNKDFKGISNSAFQGCTSLGMIALPAGTRWIFAKAFSGCTALEEIRIPVSVNIIKEDCFEGRGEALTFYTPSGSFAEEYAKNQTPPIPVVHIDDVEQPDVPPVNPKDAIENPVRQEDGTVEWSYLYFGNYPQSDATGQTKEPIKWRVLFRDGDDVFVVSDANLDVQRYHDVDPSVGWDRCTMRSWLNGYGSDNNACKKDCSSDNFIDRAFTAEEQEAIIPTAIEGEQGADDTSEWYPCEDTEDKIFLLSYQEATNTAYGFLEEIDCTDSARKFRNTAYTAAGGTIHTIKEMREQGEADKWWLRSRYDEMTNMWVDGDGNIWGHGELIEDEFGVPIYAVCPALHLDLSKDVWTLEGTVPEVCLHENTGIQNVNPATCTEAGYTGDFYCADCGAVITAGKTIPATGHQWDRGEITKAATATEDGVLTFTCKVCNEIKQEVIKASGEAKPETGEAKPEAGKVIEDTKTKDTYKVITADSKPTVEYVKPASSTVRKILIPAAVTVNGTTYQVVSVAPKAFKNCKKLKTVTIGKNVTAIGDQAFYNCTGLTKVTIPAKVEKIGKDAFRNCKKLKNITIQSGHLTGKTVGSNAFKGILAKAVIKVPKNKVAAYKKLLKKKGVSSKAKIRKK